MRDVLHGMETFISESSHYHSMVFAWFWQATNCDVTITYDLNFKDVSLLRYHIELVEDRFE
jgi:hypothetical protein